MVIYPELNLPHTPETACVWSGYIEGALAAAERAVAEVSARLPTPGCTVAPPVNVSKDGGWVGLD